MTIDSVMKTIKLFFIIGFISLFLGNLSSNAQETEVIYNFNEIKETQAASLRDAYLMKLMKNGMPDKAMDIASAAQQALAQLKAGIMDFKSKNPTWNEGDGLLAKLNDPKQSQWLEETLQKIMTQCLMHNLKNDPQQMVDTYYTIPRVILDFRGMIEKALNKLDPVLKNKVFARFERDVFEKGEKESYLKELSKRIEITFPDPRPGDPNILGWAYPPGMTFYSQSYMVLAQFSFLDHPLYFPSSVLFKFLTQTTEFKEPYGILVRDLKRLLPRKFDKFREDVQNRLMRLQGSLDPSAKIYLIQQFIPTQQLSSISHLEFFGHGFPVYQEPKPQGTIYYNEKKQPIYDQSYDLVSPGEYRKSFVEKDGNPKRFHVAPGLPEPIDYKTPIYPLRLYFDPTRYSDYVVYVFPSKNTRAYEAELKTVVDDIIKALMSDEKSETAGAVNPTSETASPQMTTAQPTKTEEDPFSITRFGKKWQGEANAAVKKLTNKAKAPSQSASDDTIDKTNQELIQKGEDQVSRILRKVIGAK